MKHVTNRGDFEWITRRYIAENRTFYILLQSLFLPIITSYFGHSNEKSFISEISKVYSVWNNILFQNFCIFKFGLGIHEFKRSVRSNTNTCSFLKACYDSTILWKCPIRNVYWNTWKYILLDLIWLCLSYGVLRRKHRQMNDLVPLYYTLALWLSSLRLSFSVV
jgi:hypothetical protein